MFLILFAGCASPRETVMEPMPVAKVSYQRAIPAYVPRLRFEGGAFAWPLKGRVVSYFGSQDDYSINKGIDIASRDGADVYAIKEGVVSYANDSLKGYGKTVMLDHGDGVVSVYAHASEILVSMGDRVNRDTVIARAGSTGRSRVCGIHFEIRKDNEPQNPLYYLP